MNISETRSRGLEFGKLFSKARPKPGLALGVIILTALIAFEIFNYSTTDYALEDLLGPLTFAGMRWSTILAIAFCGIDFAGIARLFTTTGQVEEPKQTWYLFGAWLLAATMNALLTWWGVSMAIVNHSVASTAVIDSNTLTKVVPVFVAIMVWTIRILLIGSISVNGRRLFESNPRPALRSRPLTLSNASNTARPTLTRLTPAEDDSPRSRPEPAYKPLTLNARPSAPRPAAREATQSEKRKF